MVWPFNCLLLKLHLSLLHTYTFPFYLNKAVYRNDVTGGCQFTIVFLQINTTHQTRNGWIYHTSLTKKWAVKKREAFQAYIWMAAIYRSWGITDHTQTTGTSIPANNFRGSDINARMWSFLVSNLLFFFYELERNWYFWVDLITNLLA